MSSSKTILSQHLASCALPADVIKAARLVSVYSLKAKQKQMSWVYRVIKQRMGGSSKGMNEEMSARMEEDPLRGSRPDGLFGIGSNNDSCHLIYSGGAGAGDICETVVPREAGKEEHASNKLPGGAGARLSSCGRNHTWRKPGKSGKRRKSPRKHRGVESWVWVPWKLF